MLSTPEIMLRLAAAAVLAAAIGIEREKRHAWTAGLRTHMIVSVGACLFTLASAHGFDEVLAPGRIVLDPSRIAAQIVSGIGFLGAGAILLRRDFIRGLTTASSIWTVAAIGLACGGGMYAAACFATAFTLLILAGFRPLAQRLFQHRIVHRVHIATNGGSAALADLRGYASANGLTLLNFKMSGQHDVREVKFDLTLQGGVDQLLGFVAALKAASTEERHLRIEAMAGSLDQN